MPTRLLLPIAFVMLTAWGVSGQNTAPDTLKNSTQAVTTSTVQEETVDGVWGLASYLGNKLVKEASNRMNLEESKGGSTPTRVKFKVGPFRMERVEMR